MFITALGLYEARLNGQVVGDRVLTPGWTDYRKRVPYQSYDVSALVRPGENVLGAILGDGWYCGHISWLDRQQYGERPAVLVRLKISYADGRTRSIVTDEQWRWARGAVVKADLLMGEEFDARLELPGWAEPGYDDEDWAPAEVFVPDPLPELNEALCPPVRRMETLEPVEVRESEVTEEDGTVRPVRIYDFGQNFAGRVRLKANAARGKVVRLRHAEVLNPDGSIYTLNLRGAKATDTYTCRGGGEECWEPRFTFHGFRYVEADVSGWGSDDRLELSAVVLHNDLALTGSFRCSHEGLNQLQHNILWGQKSNFLEVPTDCPQRDERLGWTGDAQVFVRTACFNMDVREFFHKWMRDLRDTQSARGGIAITAPYMSFVPSDDPNREWMDEDGGPAWADAVVICPWTIYLCYGDEQILRDNYESMARYVEFIRLHRSRDLIRSHPGLGGWGGFGDWLAKDGSEGFEGRTPRDLIGTAFFAYDAELMAKIATILDREDDAAAYRELRGTIVEAFRRRFVTPEGKLTSDTQTSYLLALHFDLLPEEARKVVAADLVRDIEQHGWHLTTGFVGTPYLLDVLEDTGHLDVAYRLLEQETYPSWLFPIRNGATTIWEHWDGWTPEQGFQHPRMNSFNHYAYGAVGAWMYRSLAGIELDPQEPGYRKIVFRPRPGGTIRWAEATLESPQGLIAIKWELDADQGLSVELEVPAGSRACFDPPTGYGFSGGELESGSHRFKINRTSTGKKF
ncbi:family 78 glycoside hydrolase catalytic domain [Ruficoccus amylovorans]|uniref:alpha-L-rhamnosidase n=1 Tax=Ruficoccus amylovorans TaxID=1804625 RepID=A0A842HFJ3_9BACT|nr:family 78 glycoside hydrolase catalytic domain [Ruficoccus amylovorans]